MNKYLRNIGILSILCFSFYCAEQTALFMQKKDPIYETIMAVEEDYQVSAIDAIIKDNYIIPGINGLTVNINQSFKNMKYVGAFQANQLVFEEVKPTVSLEQNKNKIIKQGNPYKQGVSFVVKDEQLIEYLEEMGLPYAVLTTMDTVEKNRAYGMKINYDSLNYDEVEKELTKKKENNNFCFGTEQEANLCFSKNKIMVKATYQFNKANFIEKFNRVSSGSIIYLQDYLGISNLKFLLDQIHFKGLKVLALNELLSESR